MATPTWAMLVSVGLAAVVFAGDPTLWLIYQRAARAAGGPRVRARARAAARDPGTGAVLGLFGFSAIRTPLSVLAATTLVLRTAPQLDSQPAHR